MIKESVDFLIRKRKSCRNFASKAIEFELLKKIKLILEEKSNDNFTFYLVEDNNNSLGKMGSYGFIAGADTYIVATIDKLKLDNKEIQIAFGKIFEELILKVTEFGLGTCWLGGTFNRKKFEELANIGGNETIAIVSPIGYEKGEKRLFEKLMGAMPVSRRKAYGELFFDRELKGLEEGDRVLELVRLAPSAANRQPWRIVKEENSYKLYGERKGYGKKGFDLFYNDLGIAMCHLELSALEIGKSGKWIKEEESKKRDNWEYILTYEY